MLKYTNGTKLMDSADHILLATMSQSMQEIRASITQIAEAITRLAVLEEKHGAVAIAVVKLDERMGKAESEIRNHELAQFGLISQAKGAGLVGRAVWAIAGTALGAGIFAIIKAIFAAAPIVGG